MIVQVQGEIGTTSLSQQDYLAEGGEGIVYAKHGIAYKIYKEPQRMIPVGKITELSAISHPDIIRPLNVLFKPGTTDPIGYTMRHVQDTEILVSLFPRAFRTRHGITPNDSASLMLALRERLAAVHAARCLAVDFNEYNSLVSRDFRTPYIIDVDSFQTRTFRASALMDSVRDRHAPPNKFSEETDWFAFACVAFQLLTGVHPYKGRVHSAPNMTWDERFKANLSVLSPNVSVPPPTLPFSVIPPNFMYWFEAVFNRGVRSAPPTDLIGHISMAVNTTTRILTGISSTLFRKFRDDVQYFISVSSTNAAITSESVVVNGVPCNFKAPVGAVLGMSKDRNIPILVWVAQGKALFWNTHLQSYIPSDVNAQSVVETDGRIYVLGNARVVEIQANESANGMFLSTTVACNVHPQASRIYQGCVIQSLLGAVFINLFPKSGYSPQFRMPELEGKTIIDARFSGNLLAILIKNGVSKDILLCRFAPNYRSYDVKVVSDADSLNVITLDKGQGNHIALLRNATGLCIFSTTMGSVPVKQVDAPLPGDATLVVLEGQAGMISGTEVSKISMS